ncbi:hypothetical protein [Polaromonas sp. DSR2-3-2]
MQRDDGGAMAGGQLQGLVAGVLAACDVGGQVHAANYGRTRLF